MRYLFNLAVAVVYAIVGTVIGLVYTPLSAGAGGTFGLSVMLGPICLFSLVLTGIMRQSVSDADDDRFKRRYQWRIYRYTFPVLLVYFGLPIICNGLAILLAAIGVEGLAGWLFTMRFWALLIVPVKALVVLFAYDFYKKSRTRTNVSPA